jgi:REase_DpnII-MboI
MEVDDARTSKANISEAVMPITTTQISAALDKVGESLSKADHALTEFEQTGDEYAEANIPWQLRLAYLQLSVLAEALELPFLHREITSTLRKGERAGLQKTLATPDNEPYLTWGEPARRFQRAIQAVFATELKQTITKDLEAILRGTAYSITDREAFGTLPQNEMDVHSRIEAILKCVFPDLLHKPRLTKPVKQFEPDTGIPSISTLIEFKFISDRSQVPIIADQILADTRGYESNEWMFLTYVIYETERFKREDDWRQLLASCKAAVNTNVIVLTGTSPSSHGLKKGRPRT